MNELVLLDDRNGWQGPTNGKCATRYGELLGIIQHPAFRLGFLDAQGGRALDHDMIAERIEKETPTSYWKRQGRTPRDLLEGNSVTLAQYRYEEGRLAHLMLGLRCRAWGHPDFPPQALRDYIWERADKSAPPELPTNIVAMMRGAGPLFEARVA